MALDSRRENLRPLPERPAADRRRVHETSLEVHENSRKRSAHHLDVATVGWSRRDLEALKRILVGALNINGFGKLKVLAEAIDRTYFRARSTKRWGILGRVDKGLHLELPRHVRRKSERQRVVAFLRTISPHLESLAGK